MIQLTNIYKSYRQNGQQLPVLNDLSLTIQKGEILGIAGESGVGKSTLLNILNMTEQPDQGQYHWYQQDSAAFSQQQRRQMKQAISMVFQNYNLLSNRTVLDNVLLPLKLRGQSDPKKAAELLDFVGLADKQQAYPQQLSGGQKQRAGIARALITQPQLLLWDEATSALDEQTTAEMLQLLKKSHELFQPAVVLVSHQLATIKRLCQRALIMTPNEYLEITVKPLPLAQQQRSYLEQARQRLEA